ncbi:MAG: glycosyltransferase family 1 protein [Bacteroidota bacterium]
MRIIILADPLDNQRAGIHYYTRSLVKELGKIDKQGAYYIIRRKKDDLFPPERQIIIRNFHFPGYAALRMFCIIPWKIRRLKADMVVEPAHFGPFNLPKKIKRLTVIHDLTPVLFPEFHPFHSQLLQRIFLKSILKRASLIITNSKNTRKDVIDYLDSAVNKTLNIYLGKDQAIRKTEQLPDPAFDLKESNYFLFTGTIEPRKNLSCLLEAFALYKERTGLKQQLVIAGQKGWKSKSFYRHLAKHPYRQDIILTGFIDRAQMPALYSHASAFVFPSKYEGFGLPVVEAMSCGTPCLLSSTSSLPEVGGDAALYFNPESPKELADAMAEISSDEKLRTELSDKAIKQAEKFSWEEHALKFDKEIKNLLIS